MSKLHRPRVAGLLLVLAGALGAAPLHAATPQELSDLEAKAQYAYFTADLIGLRTLARNVRTLGESADPLELYQYAHAHFRWLQVAVLQKQKRDAETAGEACVDALERATAANPRFAEAFALQASCYAYLASASALKAITAGPRAGGRIDAALAIDPKNPRVLLAQATLYYFRPSTFGGDKAKAGPLFERAAAAFDEVTATPDGEPAWGAAEAWLLAGRVREERGDRLGARSAYEKALIVAPEFAAARQRLGALAGRR